MANGIQSFLGAPDPFQQEEYTPFKPQTFQSGAGLIPVDQTNEQTFENEFMEQLLNPQDEGRSIITAQARATMNKEDASPEEKATTWGDAIGALSLYNTFDIPTQKDILNSYKTQLRDEFGIDIDDYRDINRSGDPYLAAGDTLIEANRAGYSPAQAIGKALGAFNASKKVSQLPDPNYVNLALGLLDKSATQAAAYAKAGKGSGVSKDYKITGMLDGQMRTDIVPMTPTELATAKSFFPQGTEMFEATAADKGTKNYAFLTPGGKVKHTAMRPYQYDQWVKNNPDRQIREVDNGWYDKRYALDANGDVVSGDMDWLLTQKKVTPLKNVTLTTMFDKTRGREVKVPNEAVLEDMKKVEKLRRYSAPAGNVLSVSIGENGTEITQGSGGLATKGTLSLSAINTQNARIEKAVKPLIDIANNKALIQKELSGIIREMQPLITGEAGGLASRGMAYFTGLTDSVGELIDLMGYGESPNTVFLDETSGEDMGYNEMYERFKQENKDLRSSSFYQKLSRQGADQARLDRMIFHLAIAGASAKGFTGRALSDRDLRLWMEGFGGDSMTSRRFKDTLYDTHNMILNQYQDYLDAFPLSAGSMLINEQGSKKSLSGENIPTIDQTTINPLEKMEYVTMDTKTGEYSINPGRFNTYDITEDRARIDAYRDSMGTGTNQITQRKITVDLNEDTINAWIEAQDDSLAVTGAGIAFGEIMLPLQTEIAQNIDTILKNTDQRQTQEDISTLIDVVRQDSLRKVQKKHFPNDIQGFRSFILYNRAFDSRN
jgi:hypothetical protein